MAAAEHGSLRFELRHLDVLRGLLALYVLCGHSRWLLWAGHTEWVRHPHGMVETALGVASASLRFGHEAVMIFFVLSGFFIHLGTVQRKQKFGSDHLPSARRFLARRAHRLVGPYLFALVLTITCDLLGRTWFPSLYEGRTGDELLDTTFGASGYGWNAVMPALFLLPSSLGATFGSNGPLWSIAYEVVYYGLYPLWLRARARSTIVAFVVLPLACLMTASVESSGFAVAVALHYPIWLTGAVLAEWSLSLRSDRSIAAFAGIGFILGFLLYLVAGSIIIKIVAASIFGSSAVTIFAVLPKKAGDSWIASILEFVGLRSYSIYILHFPVLVLFAAAVIETYGRRPLAGWAALGGGVLAIVMGCIGFAACERHFLHPRLRLEAQSS